MKIEIEDQLREHFNITDEEMSALCLLSTELWSGPLYIPVNPSEAEDELTINGKTYYFCGWGSAEVTTESAFHVLLEINQPLIDRFETIYYEPDSGSILVREPQGCWDSEFDDTIEPESEDDSWNDPMDYYSLTVQEILGQLVGARTAREMWVHF